MIQSMPNDYKTIINNCITTITEDTNAAVIKALEESTTTKNTTSNDLMSDRFPHMLLEGDSDETESAASGVVEEDPNDPEWLEPAPRS